MMSTPCASKGAVTIPCPVCRSGRWKVLFCIGGRQIVQCDRCGHEYVNPLPAAQRRIEYEFAPDESEGEHTRIDLYYLQGVFDRYGLSNCRLLDLGCGDGRLGPGMLKAGWDRQNLYFMDNSAAVLDRLRMRLGAENVCLGDAAEGIACDAPFDCVIMVEFLEDTVRPVEIMRNVAEALRSGGFAIVRALPNNRSLEAMLGGRNWKMRTIDKHYNFFNPDSFSRFAGQFQGLRVLEFGCFLQPGFRFYDPVRVARNLGLIQKPGLGQASGGGTEPTDQAEHAAALLREMLTGGRLDDYWFADGLPRYEPEQLSTAEGIQEFFDTAYLDYRLSPDFSVVLHKAGAD